MPGWRLLGLALGIALAGRLGAALPGGVTVHSRSGQFIVHSPRPTQSSLSEVTPVGTNKLVRIEPDPLSVSCERIKGALLDELGLKDQWRGKIHVTIDPRARGLAEPIPGASRYADGWQYSLRVPGEIDATALVRGVVQVLLMELANRAAGPNVPEVPIWLVEALTGQIEARIGPDPVAKTTAVAGKYGSAVGALTGSLSDRRLADDRRRTFYHLLSQPALSLQEICLPGPEQLSPDGRYFYRLNCQLLFDSLRRLPGGLASIQAMIGRLPQTLNWQTAFLAAFQGQFPRLLDAEKWWALRTAQLENEAGKIQLPADVGLLRLDDLLGVTVQVRRAVGAPPRRVVQSLQTIIQDWDFSQQAPVLRARASQLRVLEPALPPDLQSIAAGYARTLLSYVEQRKNNASQPTLPGLASTNLDRLVRATLDQLTTLDRQRAAVRTRLGATAKPVGPGS